MTTSAEAVKALSDLFDAAIYGTSPDKPFLTLRSFIDASEAREAEIKSLAVEGVKLAAEIILLKSALGARKAILPDWEGFMEPFRAECVKAGIDTLRLDAATCGVPRLVRERDDAQAELSRLRSLLVECGDVLEPMAMAGALIPEDQQDFKIVAAVPGGYNAKPFAAMAQNLTAGNFRAASSLLPRIKEVGNGLEA